MSTEQTVPQAGLWPTPGTLTAADPATLRRLRELAQDGDLTLEPGLRRRAARVARVGART